VKITVLCINLDLAAFYVCSFGCTFVCLLPLWDAAFGGIWYFGDGSRVVFWLQFHRGNDNATQCVDLPYVLCKHILTPPLMLLYYAVYTYVLCMKAVYGFCNIFLI